MLFQGYFTQYNKHSRQNIVYEFCFLKLACSTGKFGRREVSLNFRHLLGIHILILVTFLLTAVTHNLLQLTYQIGTWHCGWDLDPQLLVIASMESKQANYYTNDITRACAHVPWLACSLDIYAMAKGCGFKYHVQCHVTIR